MITGLDAGDSIVVAKSFSHMLNLANLAEEVKISRRRRNKLKKGDFADENNATTESDIEETLKKLVFKLKKSPQEVFDALKNQTVDLVLTAHPTQSVRRSLLQKHARFISKYSIFQLYFCFCIFFQGYCLKKFFFFHRIRNSLSQLYAKDITPDDKQELDEALQREVSIKAFWILYDVLQNCHNLPFTFCC